MSKIIHQSPLTASDNAAAHDARGAEPRGTTKGQTAMYDIDLNTADALAIIKRSVVLHPSLFADALLQRRVGDITYAGALPSSHGTTYRSVMASANAAERAYAAVKAENVDAFASDIAAGIIALNIACKLQCLPPHVRTSAALRTWEQAA